MTWVDIAIILFWLSFLAVGARQGSLWTGACILGGFLAASLVDYYTLPVAQMLGGFSGAPLAAGLLLFMGGLLVTLVPGALLSKIGSAPFLGLLNSAFGLVTGAFTGAFLIALATLVIFPMFPRVEKSEAYRKSLVIRPFHTALEEVFSIPPAPTKFMARNMKKGNKLADQATDKIFGLAKRLDPSK